MKAQILNSKQETRPVLNKDFRIIVLRQSFNETYVIGEWNKGTKPYSNGHVSFGLIDTSNGKEAWGIWPQGFRANRMFR